jgi:hypothetical protein
VTEPGDVSDPELEELLRAIDRLCAQRDWDGVLALRDRARASYEHGQQHWPAAAHAEYRLALEAPGEYAGAMIVEGAGRFAFGPLAEVAASTHTWAELAPHIPPGPLAAITAHERIVRGEDLEDDDRVDPDVLPLPLALEAWEPSYPVATYRPDKADFPMPARPAMLLVELPPPPHECSTDADEVLALRAVVRPWLAESNGHADAAGVRGDAGTALAALGLTQVRMVEIAAADAVALLAWAGASGGAEGRRRGMAWGRFVARDAAAALAGLSAEDAEVPEVLDELRWYAFDDVAPSTGWTLRLAVEDPVDGYAWAIDARDAVDPSTRSR